MHFNMRLIQWFPFTVLFNQAGGSPPPVSGAMITQNDDEMVTQDGELMIVQDI